MINSSDLCASLLSAYLSEDPVGANYGEKQIAGVE